MPVCRGCKFYTPTDDTVGDCFGVEVSGDTDVGNCPADAYQPKDWQYLLLGEVASPIFWLVMVQSHRAVAKVCGSM